MRVLSRTVAVVIWLVFLPAAAYSQASASIAGVVKDTSGAVLPGVTVEASSPALIERVRSVVTDSTGQYKILQLRPGTYVVTFTLPAFTTVRREGIELSGSFTAAVNAELKVGAVAETITVTGATPIVDVQSIDTQRVLQKDVIDAIPAGRSFQDLALLVPGITAGPDIGGLNTLSITNLAMHGGSSADARTFTDGIALQNIGNNSGSVSLFPDMGSTQEVVVDSSAGSAEMMYGGVNVNFVPREGGNTFHGTFFGTGADSHFQSSNYTQDLKNRGLTTPNSIYRVYDVDGSAGGPIRRDKLWFYSAVRRQTNGIYLAGLYNNLNAGDPNAWTYAPDLSNPSTNSTTQSDYNTRVTWQASRLHKFNFSVETQPRYWESGNSTTSTEAKSIFTYPKNLIATSGWSAPLSSRLLLEVRVAVHSEAIDSIIPPEGTVARALIPVSEQGGLIPGLLYRGGGTQNGPNFIYSNQDEPHNLQLMGSVSYVTGSHAFKIGFDHLQGSQTSPQTDNDSGLSYRFNNGVPNQITQRALPVDRLSSLKQGGVYAQDKWTVRRLTLSGGLRVDYLNTFYPEQYLGPGVNVPTRSFTIPATPWYALRDLMPRVGAAYDLFGNGKTALKVSAGKYVTSLDPVGTNPIFNLANTVTRSWTPSGTPATNPNYYIPQCDLLNPQQNGQCGTISDLRFGQAIPSTTYDPATLVGWGRRPYQWEISTSVQHQLLSNVGVNLGYFRRIYGNFTVTDNTAVAPSDYTSFSVPVPVNAQLPGGGGNLLGGFYNLNPNKVGQVANYVTQADDFGGQIQHWNGIDATVNVRLLHGALVQGGLSTGRTTTDNCPILVQLPGLGGSNSTTYCHVDTPFLTQMKLLGTYTVPKVAVNFAATFQSLPAPQITANYVASNAIIQPSLGRPLSGGAANATVTILPPGMLYGERLNDLDLRFTKLFPFGRMKTRVNFDLYNAFNRSPVLSQNNTFGPAWQTPTGILQARLFKISAQFDF